MPQSVSKSKEFNQILKGLIALLIFLGIIFFSAKLNDVEPKLANEVESLEQNGLYFLELGKAYDYAGDRELAYKYLIKAKDLLPPDDPQLLSVYVLLCRLLLPFDKPLDLSSKQEIEKYAAILIDPKNTKTEQSWGYSVLAEFRGVENNKVDQINFAKQAVYLDPENAAAWHVYGFALFVGSENGKRVYYTNHLDDAIVALAKSVEIQKTMSPSWYLLGVANWLKGEREIANEMWQKSLKLLPDDPYYPAWFKSYLKEKIDSAIKNPEEIDKARR